MSLDSEVTLVLRACPGCGRARITVLGYGGLRRVQSIDLDAAARTRRIVRFDDLDTSAENVTIAVSEARSSGVTLEGLHSE